MVEISIAMLIGMLLCSAIIHLLITTKNTIKLQQAKLIIQENSTTFNYILGTAIRQAGSSSCGGFFGNVCWNIHANIPTSSLGLEKDKRVYGPSFTSVQSNQLINQSIKQRISQTSDIIWIKSVINLHKLASPLQEGSSYLQIQGKVKMDNMDLLAISDCSNMDFFTIEQPAKYNAKINCSTLAINKSQIFSKLYSDLATVGKFSSQLFYIGKTKRLNLQQKPILSLYLSDLNDRTLELVEGVELMRLEYATRHNGEIIYQPAQFIKDWAKVFAVRAKVLFNSIDDVLINPQPYCVDGIKVFPKDCMLRQWFDFEWKIRGIAN